MPSGPTETPVDLCRLVAIGLELLPLQIKPRLIGRTNARVTEVFKLNAALFQILPVLRIILLKLLLQDEVLRLLLALILCISICWPASCVYGFCRRAAICARFLGDVCATICGRDGADGAWPGTAEDIRLAGCCCGTDATGGALATVVGGGNAGAGCVGPCIGARPSVATRGSE
ncbi:hypothetical protein DXU03_26185 [Rhizobium johnstonii]